MKKICLLMVLCGFLVKSHARALPYDQKFIGDFQWIPCLKVGYVGGFGLDNTMRNGAELGFHYCNDGILFLHGPSATLTLAYENQTFRLIPKVGYEASFVFLTGKLDFWIMNSDLYFTTSAGIMIHKKDIHVLFGYNVCTYDDLKSGLHFSAV